MAALGRQLSGSFGARRPAQRALAWGLAAGGTAALTAASLPFRSELGLAGFLLLTLLVVIAAAIAGGLWPAVAGVALSLLAGSYFFAVPYESLSVALRLHNVPLVAYLIVGVALGVLVQTLADLADEQASLSRRIVAASDETRRQIERDLHDGAQQRLVAVALRLRTLQRSLPLTDSELTETLKGTADSLTAVIDELREMARGIHPAILAQGGLGPALRTLARRSPVPVETAIEIDGRLPDQVEVAAYYVVSEALANVAKHAAASRVTIEARVTAGGLRIAIGDDGVGGAQAAAGSGITGLSDRVRALGGTVVLSSPAGAGTRLTAQLPTASSWLVAAD